MDSRLRPLPLLRLLLCGLAAAPVPAQLLPKRFADAVPPAAAARLQGLWAGTATEQVEGAGEMSFPIELRFAGEPAALRLEVSGTVKVPTEGGQTVTVAIAASYRGALEGADLRMRSEKVETRIVEFGEVLPSGPQVLEARLADGELRGRVGSEDEGWTSFRARPAGATAEPAAPAAGFTGSWQGSGREAGPDGSELRYPVTARIDDADGGLVVRMQADLQYPVGGGRTVPVQYRATFRGRADGGELRLQSDQVEIHLVEQGRTEAGPGQRAVGRLSDGVLRLEVGDAASGISQLELRRAADAPAPGAGGRGAAGAIESRPAPGLGERRSGAASPYATLVLERREVRDPGMGGVVSHTLMVPEGWNFEGAPVWTANPDSFVHFVGVLRGPGQEELGFGQGRILTFQAVSGQPARGLGGPGDDQPDGTIVRQPPQRFGEVALEILLPRLRPGATEVQLIDASRLPQVEEKFRTAHAAELQMLEQMLQSTRNTGTPQVQADASLFLVAERALVRYRLDGRVWDEEIRSTQFGTRYEMRSELMSSTNSAWQISSVICSRAPQGQLEACLPVLLTLAGSVEETPRWSNAVAEIRLAIGEARLRGQRLALDEQRRRGEAAARDRAELSDAQMQSWRSRQDSIDRMHKATIDSIRGTTDFQTADGTVHAVSNQYERAFVAPGGRLVLTSDPNVEARTGWEELRRVDPLEARGR